MYVRDWVEGKGNPEYVLAEDFREYIQGVQDEEVHEMGERVLHPRCQTFGTTSADGTKQPDGSGTRKDTTTY